MRLNDEEPWRLKNLIAVLDWLDWFYEDMFDILLVEQDNKAKLNPSIYKERRNVRYEFIFNPDDYNRGWGYNVAVKHFCPNNEVVALMDTDVLPGRNFLGEIRDCLIGKYDVISPYQNIYYTDEEEASHLIVNKYLSSLTDSKKIKNPVTITGGIIIIKRNIYMELSGFEQYIGYGCEDRAFDVTILNMVNENKIRVAPFVYAHLFHPVDKKARKNWNQIYNHLQENYQCQWHKELGPLDYIHSKCNHADRKKIIKSMAARILDFGRLDLYSQDELELLANGTLNRLNKSKPILPENFQGYDYDKREVYNAPPPDSEDLSALHNMFIGERCFIIGNGPSLNKHDLSLLENEYTFGVNSFYYKTRETGFRPTFYVVEDSSVMKENIEEIKNFYAPFKFFPTIYKNLHPKDPNTFFFTMNRGFYEKSSLNYCIPRFSPDATKELYCGQSVTFINLQLAYFMGFTEVYLIGMDFSYVIPESHKRNGDVLLSDSDDPNHFHKDYFGKGKTWKDPKLERVGMNYRMAKIAYDSTNRKIYNATIGGELEVFPRVDYLKLFNKKGKSDQSICSVNNNESFRTANRLFRSKMFNESAKIYLNLYKYNSSVFVYKKGLVLSYLSAIEKNQAVDENVSFEIKELI